MEKRERKVVPGRGMKVGMCVVYFGSSESLEVLEYVGKEIRDEAGKAAWGQVKMGFECQVKELQIYYVAGTTGSV